MDENVLLATLEQTMLYLLILGRWFIPRGKLTHDQLSQLLMVFIGMASDIMELFYLFADHEVVMHDFLGYVILAIWSLSLLQFTLVLTTRQQKKMELSIDTTVDKTQLHEETEKTNLCHRTEVWAILVSLALQDVPFVAVRLYVGFGLNVFTFNLLFFTMKNIIVILLQVYRLAVIVGNIN